MANKNTKQARARGFSSMADLLKGQRGHRVVRGVCVDPSRPAGKARWIGAERAAKRMGAPDID